MGSVYCLLAVGIAVLGTQLTRWAPFLLFGGKRGIPGPVRYLGMVLPGAIMAVLVAYCFRGITPLEPPYGLPQLIAGAVVVLLHLWKRNTLLSIAGGTFCYMLLIRLVFPG